MTDLHDRLASIESDARKLPWAGERAWRRSSHLGRTDGLVAIDLHDLSVRLALAVVDKALDPPPDSGGVVFITGRGNHTGGRSKLKLAVESSLQERARAGELRFHPVGPGRFRVITDAERARQPTPWVLWLVAALVLAGIAAAVWNQIHGR